MVVNIEPMPTRKWPAKIIDIADPPYMDLHLHVHYNNYTYMNVSMH